MSSNPDKAELLALILRQAAAPPRPREPELSLRPRPGTSVRSDFQVWLQELMRHLPPPSDAELDDYYLYALMGLTVGFGDRNLSPFVEAHTEIIAPMLADIRSVFEQIRSGGQAYSPERFIFRAFDYGIHKAYYLDWDLYLSHDMY